jgi:protein phosphatase 1 regulatory subunit 16A
MEHFELIQEMVLLEKLTAQERLKHAKRRRQQQLSNWIRREVAIGNSTTISSPMAPLSNNIAMNSIRKKTSLVQFPENIVLLEGKENLFLFF